MPLYGHELSESIDPLTAQLGFACTLGNRDFIGSAALENLAENPAPTVRVGLLPDSRRPAREGYPVLNAEGQAVGEITSGSQSPTLGRPIAMAYVRRDDVSSKHLQIDIRGTSVPAEIVQLPFYRRN